MTEGEWQNLILNLKKHIDSERRSITRIEPAAKKSSQRLELNRCAVQLNEKLTELKGPVEDPCAAWKQPSTENDSKNQPGPIFELRTKNRWLTIDILVHARPEEEHDTFNVIEKLAKNDREAIAILQRTQLGPRDKDKTTANGPRSNPLPASNSKSNSQAIN